MYQQLVESESEENVDLAFENVIKIVESSLKDETPENLKKNHFLKRYLRRLMLSSLQKRRECQNPQEIKFHMTSITMKIWKQSRGFKIFTMIAKMTSLRKKNYVNLLQKK